MDRFFSVLQTTARLDPGFSWCPTGHCQNQNQKCLLVTRQNDNHSPVLGPLLFSLYINDISTDIDSEIRFFADDCVCYRKMKDTEDTLKLQKDIDQLACWQGNGV